VAPIGANLAHRESVSLSAVFFLEQTEIDQAVPLGQGKAAAMINQLAGQVCAQSWSGLPARELRASRLSSFDNASEISRVVPSFTLKVRLNGEFWREMDRVLWF
jgi:SynChlorMet cassette protein ScmC